MIIRILSLFLIFFSSQLVAPDKNTPVFICNYFDDDPPLSLTVSPDNGSGQTIIKNIVAIIGLKPNFEVRQANVSNAAAVVFRGKRLVLYNSDFIKQLNEMAGSQWATISILAHEVGHHLNGHTLVGGGSRPDLELEADEFSGFVLRKMGASLKEAQVAMSIASSVKASHTHPAKRDRLSAIADGWNTADAQMGGKTIPAKSNPDLKVPVIEKTPSTRVPSVLDAKYIAYNVYLDADKNGKYFVTIRNNLVKVENEKIFLAGLLAKSNKKNYPFMFYDKHYNYLYLTKSLQIVNGSGKKVGHMQKAKP